MILKKISPLGIYVRIDAHRVLHMEAEKAIHVNAAVVEAIRQAIPDFSNIIEVEYFYRFGLGRIYWHASDWIMLTEEGDLLVVETDHVHSRLLA